jgi:integrase
MLSHDKYLACYDLRALAGANFPADSQPSERAKFMGLKITWKAIETLQFPAGKTEHVEWDSEIKGFGFRMRAGGKRTLVYQYSFAGRIHKMTLAAATAEAFKEGYNKLGVRSIAAKLEAEVRLGRNPAAEKQEARTKAANSFGAVAKLFLDHKQSKVRASTFANVERHVATNAKSLYPMPLSDVGRKDIARVLTSIRNRGRDIEANRTRSTLIDMFAWAMGEGLADANPVIGTNRTDEESRDRVLSAGELKLIWDHSGDSEFGKIIRLLMLTGCRAREISGLRWPEIDLQAATINLPKERVKNRKAFTIPLSPTAKAIVESVPRRAGRDLLFGKANCGPYDGWTVSRDLLDKRIEAAAGERLEPWVVHDIRRSVVTHMADLGILPHIIEACVNHQSGAKGGVAGIYNRSTYEPEKREAMERWATRLAVIVSGASNVVSGPWDSARSA